MWKGRAGRCCVAADRPENDSIRRLRQRSLWSLASTSPGRTSTCCSRSATTLRAQTGNGSLRASAEASPELKGSAAHLELQQRVSGLEEQIAHRREFDNATVNLNNVRMEQCPDSLLAGLARMSLRAHFLASEEEKADVDVGARPQTAL